MNKHQIAEHARRSLTYATIICFVFMIAEIVGGLYANSLAILTDAAHLLSDIASFLISIVSIWLGTLPSTTNLSYGYLRAEIIGVIISILLIWSLTGILVYEAVLRTMDCLSDNPTLHIDGKVMTIVASCGLLVNLSILKVLGGHGHSHHGHSGSHGHSHHGHSHHGHSGSHGHSHHGHDHNNHIDLEENDIKSNESEGLLRKRNANYSSISSNDRHNDHDHEEIQNINVRAAYIHALGDLIQSIGVIIAGCVIMYNPKWQIADPIATFFFSMIVLYSTIGIMRSCLQVLMEGTPEGINLDAINDKLLQIDHVVGLHDLHVWALTYGVLAASIHIETDDIHSDVLPLAEEVFRKFNIGHTTIQIEKTFK